MLLTKTSGDVMIFLARDLPTNLSIRSSTSSNCKMKVQVINLGILHFTKFGVKGGQGVGGEGGELQ